MPLKHDLIRDLLVFDVELEPADKGVDRVPAGVDHDVAADGFFALHQQPELHLALPVGILAGVVADPVGERRVARGPVEQRVHRELGDAHVLLTGPARSRPCRQGGQPADEVRVGCFLLKPLPRDHQVDRGERQGRNVVRVARPILPTGSYDGFNDRP